MKITLSKQQWEFIGKKTGWIKTTQTKTVELIDENDTVIPKSTVDQEILDRFLGKHMFNIYDVPQIEKKLWEKGQYSISIDGRNFDGYMRQKTLKKYNLL